MMSLKSAFEVIQHVGREKTWTCIFAPAKLLNSAKVLVDEWISDIRWGKMQRK